MTTSQYLSMIEASTLTPERLLTLQAELTDLLPTYPALSKLLFDPPTECLRSLSAFCPIPDEIKQKMKKFPIKLRNQIGSRIQSQFLNQESWPQELQIHFAQSLKELKECFSIAILKLQTECLIPKMQNILALYDVMSMKKKVDMRERINPEDIEMETQFFEKNIEILNGECQEEDSLQCRRIQKLGENEKLQCRLRTLKMLRSNGSMYRREGRPNQSQLTPFYDLLPTFEQPWLLSHLIGLRSEKSSKLSDYIISLKLTKVGDSIVLIGNKQEIHPKQITQEIIGRCIEIGPSQSHRFNIFMDGSMLEDSGKVYLKLNYSEIKEFDSSSILQKQSRNNADTLAEAKRILEYICLLLEQICNNSQILFYKSFGVFEELPAKQTFELIKKLLSCYKIMIRSSTRMEIFSDLRDLCLSPAYYPALKKILVFSESRPISQSEEANGILLSILRFLIEDNESKLVHLADPTFLDIFVGLANRTFQESPKLPTDLGLFLNKYVPKLFALGFDPQRLKLVDLYELKWKTISQPNKAKKNILISQRDLMSPSHAQFNQKAEQGILVFMESFPGSIAHFVGKLEDIQSLKSNLKEVNVFQGGDIDQLVAIVTIYAHDPITSTSQTNQSIRELLRDYASLLPREMKGVDWTKLAQKISLDLPSEIQRYDEIVLNLLKTDKVVGRMNPAQLCQEESSDHPDLVHLIKQVNYLKLLLMMNGGKFISVESLRKELSINLEMQLMESISLNIIVQYQGNYSPEKLKEVRELYRIDDRYHSCYMKLYAVISDFNQAFWLSVAQYSLTEINQLLRNFDLIILSLRSTDGNHILKYLKKIHRNLLALSDRKGRINLSFQLFNYHPEILLSTLGFLWSKYQESTEESQNVVMGASYLRFVSNCQEQKLHASTEFNNILKPHIKQELSNFFKFLFTSEKSSLESMLLNDKIYKGSVNVKAVKISVACNVLLKLKEQLTPQLMDLALSLTKYLLSSTLDLTKVMSGLGDQESSITNLNVQLPNNPILMVSAAETVTVVGERKANLLAKLFDMRYCEEKREKTLELSVLLLDGLGKQAGQSLKKQWIEIIIYEINENIASSELNSARFQSQSLWMDKLLRIVKDIRQLECFSSTFLKNEIKVIFYLLASPQNHQQPIENSLSLIQKLIPNSVQNSNADTKAYLHILLQTALKIIAAVPKPNETALLSIIHKVVKINSSEYDPYIQKLLEKRGEIDLSSVLPMILEREDNLMSMEADVRGYFLKESQNLVDETQAKISTQMRKFISCFKVKYQHDIVTFSNLVAKLVRKTLLKENERQILLLSYDKQHPFDFSAHLSAPFASWRPPVLFRSLLPTLLQLDGLNEQALSNKLNNLRSTIYYHPNVLPYLLLHPVTIGQRSLSLLDYLVELTATSAHSSLHNFLLFVCLDHSCIVSCGKPIFYAEYLCYRIAKLLLAAPLTQKSLLFIYFMTQLKRFSFICKLTINEKIGSIVDSLTNVMKDNRQGFERKDCNHILAGMALSIIYKQDEIDNLRKCYTPKRSKEQQKQYRFVEECLIPFNTIYRRSSVLSKREDYIAFCDNLTSPAYYDENQALRLDEEYAQFEASLIHPNSPQLDDIQMIDSSTLTDLDLSEAIKRLYNISIEKKAIDFNDILENNFNSSHLRSISRLRNLIHAEKEEKDDDNEGGNIFNGRRIPYPMRGGRGRGGMMRRGERGDEDEGAAKTKSKEIEKEFEKSLVEIPLEPIESESPQKIESFEDIRSGEKELQNLLENINNLRIMLNQPELFLHEISEETFHERKKFLQRKYLEAEFDFNEEEMTPDEFNSYLCSKSNQMEVLSERRRRKIDMAEGQQFLLNIQRTFSKESIGYAIDTLYENEQNIPAIKRELSQVESMEEEFEVGRQMPFLFENKRLPLHVFSDINQDLLYQMMLSLYYGSEEVGNKFVLPFVENKRVQPKVINTLIHIMRHPFDSPHFPHQLYRYNLKDNMWKTEKMGVSEAKERLIDRILSVLEPIKNFCYYENKQFLMEETTLEGLNGIILEPNQKYADLSEVGTHIPIFQIIELLFETKSELITYFLKDIQTLPQNLLSKLFQKLQTADERYFTRKEDDPHPMRTRRIRQTTDFSLYENIRSLYSNPAFLDKFRQIYPIGEKNPNPAALATMINTPIYSAQEMKNLHLLMLQSKKQTSENFSFLNKVLEIYTDEELKSATWLGEYQSLLLALIKYMGSQEIKIEKEPLFRIFKFPVLMSAEMKRELLEVELAQRRPERRFNHWEDDDCLIVEKKKGIFESTFEKLKEKPDSYWLGHFRVKFRDENGVLLSGGGPGVNKEWYSLVTIGMVNLNYALFTRTPANFYYFNRQSHINPLHLQYFEFIGKLFGHSLIERTHFVCPSFSRILYKRILGLPIEIEDMIAEKFEEGAHYKAMSFLETLTSDEDFVDLGINGMKFTYSDKRLIADQNYQLIKNSQKLEIKTKNDNTRLFLSEEKETVVDPDAKDTESMSLADVPTIDIKYLNVAETIELLPDGANININFANRLEYLRLLREKILEIVGKQVDKQFERFLKGMQVVIDPKTLSKFTVDELRDLIEGSSQISVADLRENLICNDYGMQDQLMTWFFEILSSLSSEDFALFIHFWTGEPKIQPEGFKGMRMTIKRSTNNKFKAQTCFNLIHLPEYNSKELLREMMLQGVESIRQNKADIEEN